MTTFDAAGDSDRVTLKPSIAEKLRMVQQGLNSRPYNRAVNGIEKRERDLTGEKNYARAALRAIYQAGKVISIGAYAGGLATSVAATGTFVGFAGLTMMGIIADTAASPAILAGIGVAGASGLAGSIIGINGWEKTDTTLNWLKELAKQPKSTTLSQAKDSLLDQKQKREDTMRQKLDTNNADRQAGRSARRASTTRPGM